jgi:Arc/MetJ family transcription regulator
MVLGMTVGAAARVGHHEPMRLHIALDDDLVAELDRRVGPRQRSAFIAELIRRGLDDEQRWDDVESALGGIAPFGHEWDADPVAWVRIQRGTDPSRVG